MTAGRTLPPSSGDHPFVDIVDFVERTTYAIWNDRRPELVGRWYGPHTMIWRDAGNVLGAAAVTAHTQDEQAMFADMGGVVQDTIWTGDERSGYRTSMRWQERGTHTGPGPLGAPTGRAVRVSSIANCIVVGDQYVEEWAVGDGRALVEQLGVDPGSITGERPSPDLGEYRSAEQQGASVPAVPDTVDGAGLFVAELLTGLYEQRRLDRVDTGYAPGAAYQVGESRWYRDHQGIRAEVDRWLRLLPDLRLQVQELYWLDDAPRRSRVAVRYRLAGTARVHDVDRPVAVTQIHHVHVRGDQVVAEWAECDELALQAQLRGSGPVDRPAAVEAHLRNDGVHTYTLLLDDRRRR